MSNPYSKRDQIEEQLIEELIFEGPKRPTKIKALEQYSSKQDKYALLKRLVNEGMITKTRFSHKNVEYSLPKDKHLNQFTQRYKQSRADFSKLKDEINNTKQDSNQAIGYRVSILLYQLTNILEGITAISYYEIYKPKTRKILTSLLRKEIENMIEILKLLNKAEHQATGIALKIVGQQLQKIAIQTEKMKSKI